VFVHIIRDGREVAASLAELGERDSIEVAASYWRDAVRRARRAGMTVGPRRYCEVRLEELISQPQTTLKRVCAAVGEAYDPGMLDYPRRGAETLRYIEPRYRRTHRHLDKPPTSGLRDWRGGLSCSRCREVDAICRPLLEELGYPD
jgi:Sulfotransferase family